MVSQPIFDNAQIGQCMSKTHVLYADIGAQLLTISLNFYGIVLMRVIRFKFNGNKGGLL